MNQLPTAARELLESMLGKPFADAIERTAQGGFGASMAQLAVNYAFTDVWNRPGLDRRARSLVTLGILLALHLPNEFKNHVRAGVANGLTPEEIEEICLHASIYVGLPLAGEALQAAVLALREKGLIDSATTTSTERGML
jgi:4-carboxymuconolactone decarboxylase